MSFELSWNQLLSSRRPSLTDRPSRNTEPDERSRFEQDYDRIIFSQPFRRLARKTQVHPMATNDHIHNRLTHSIEVACVGRSFARRVTRRLQGRYGLVQDHEEALIWITQSACLIHDLGNPPFGHAGEEVVRAWVESHREEMFENKLYESEEQKQGIVADWMNFEGNAQGFRLAARPDNAMAGYLRVTHATLASAIKYPWLSTDTRVGHYRKLNVYSTEEQLFQSMARDLGLIGTDGLVRRHPLSFLTEAADDICYRIIDMEDAVEMGIGDESSIRKLFFEIVEQEENPQISLPQLRGMAIRSLIDKFWGAFETHYDSIMHGERTKDLKSSLDERTQAQLFQIKTHYESIFGHSRKVATEVGAYHILGRILKALMKTINAIEVSETYDDLPFLSRRCIQLAWDKEHAVKNFRNGHAWWLAQMKDFVCGMTDDYATLLSSQLGGHLILKD